MVVRTSEKPRILHPIITGKVLRQREYTRRKDPHVFQTVHPADVQQFEADGWTVHREGTRKVRLKRLKSPDVLLEDQTWCLFYRMGYADLNGSRFTITYRRHDGSEGAKQVDVFAKDEETVVLVECKARETRGKRTLQKDLHETESLQKPFANSIRTHYGGAFRPKIIWMYVTNNIIWSEPDLERAAAINVRVVTENEMQYFDSFIRHMGPAGRFQFLAEYLDGQTIPELSDIRIPATRGTLGKHKFYSFLTTPRHLLKIAFVNHLALNHPDGRPAYQRMVAPSRIREIGNFVKHGGFFPTNLLINFTEKIRFDLLPNKENSDSNIKFGWLYLPNKYKSAWVIDGQHRLYGYSHIDEKYWDQSIAVIAFEGMDTKDEADLFVTINHKQKSVPRSVIVALQADLKWGSDEPAERLSALCSRLTKTLNSDPTSPLFQRFSSQGVVAKENQSLTMPEVVNGLKRSGLIGRMLHKGLLSPGPLSGATDEDTNDRARRVLNGYFAKIREAHPQRWEAARAAYISTNPGIRAQLLLLAEVIRYTNKKDDIEPQLLDEDTLLKQVLRIIAPVLKFIGESDDADIYDKFSRKFGEGGVREYADNLAEIILPAIPDFGSEDFRQRLAKRSDERAKQTNEDIVQLNKDITDYVFKVLKDQYGITSGRSGQPAFWDKGIESPKIKQEAYSRMLAEGSKLPPEAYVDILGIKEIVTQKTNWPHFEQVFNIPMKGEAKGKHHYIAWLTRFNEIRRVPAHSSGIRTYEEKDYEDLRQLQFEFYKRRNEVLGILEPDSSE
ncbi:MAG: DGQHR domain-containing protein [Betaproteobacteria bacterium]|nr:DGQHR domain-containing protein [Betaproteobacteria bacterium]